MFTGGWFSLTEIIVYEKHCSEWITFVYRVIDRRGGGAGYFVAGFILGGPAFGSLGCIVAPQVARALICFVCNASTVLSSVI